MTRLIIGLTGNKGSGKDSFSKALKDIPYNGENRRRFLSSIKYWQPDPDPMVLVRIEKMMKMTPSVGFADNLREVCAVAFQQQIELFTNVEVKDSPALPVTPCSHLGLEDDPLKTDFTPRDVQREVAETLRAIFPTIWIDPVIKKINGFREVNWIVTDLRYPDQAYALKHYTKDSKVVVVNIKRPGFNGDSHVSETSFASIPHDYMLINDSTLEHFENKCRNLLANIYYKHLTETRVS
jgi:hypothetical protein